MFARSYLHSARSYWFHNSIPTNIPKAYKSGNPISVGSQTAIQGITSNTPFRPHVYKYITGADEPGEEEPDFPGLEHDPSANTAPLWGPEFPAV